MVLKEPAWQQPVSPGPAQVPSWPATHWRQYEPHTMPAELLVVVRGGVASPVEYV
jgi:hypothetical protein